MAKTITSDYLVKTQAKAASLHAEAAQQTGQERERTVSRAAIFDLIGEDEEAVLSARIAKAL